MKNAAKILAMSTALVAAFAASAGAADLAEPMVVEAPVYEAPEAMPAAVSGWYIRGDVGYGMHSFRGADYMTNTGFDGFLTGKLKGSFSVGAGVGYQFTHNLRADVTADYDFKSTFSGTSSGTCSTTAAGPDGVLGTADDVVTAGVACSSTDTASWTALTLLANAYVDLGTYHGFTPYVGAGIGGARVTWSGLDNTISGGFDQDGVYSHAGHANWRFAYALMAGVSIEATKNLAIDLGYRYRRIEGNKMFGYDAASGTGIGVDRGITSHQFRAGLRYKFGGSSYAGGNCCGSTVSYDQAPVYK